MSFSIPVVMRSIINKAKDMKKSLGEVQGKTSNGSSILANDATRDAPREPFDGDVNSFDNVSNPMQQASVPPSHPIERLQIYRIDYFQVNRDR